jgi:hypothetical protein
VRVKYEKIKAKMQSISSRNLLGKKFSLRSLNGWVAMTWTKLNSVEKEL